MTTLCILLACYGLWMTYCNGYNVRRWRIAVQAGAKALREREELAARLDAHVCPREAETLYVLGCGAPPNSWLN